MKKIILSAGMLIAVATASFAQNNTTTINQAAGERNVANSTQTGQNLNATINTNDAQATDNKATITQKGRENGAAIVERGKFNEVLINQDNLGNSGATAGHEATVNITNSASQGNSVDVIQSGKEADAIINLEGDNNVVTFTQGGDKNQADLIMNAVATNDDNTVTIDQVGDRNQASATVQGDRNSVDIDQAGFDNKAGTYQGSNNLTVTYAPSAPFFMGGGSPPITGVVTTGGSITAPDGVTINGNDNTVAITQGANTRNNQVAVELQAGADENTATVNQSGNARRNTAVIQVLAGQINNTATINQTGDARDNQAGIFQSGSDDMATINQTGIGNSALIAQRVGTNIGNNMATINQPGTNNQAFIDQDGIRGSTATINQLQDGGTVGIFQTGQGGHTATVTQDSDISGARLILKQDGRSNTATLLQEDRNFQATDVEITQIGQNNTAIGINNGSQRVTQTGNGNMAQY